LSSDSDGSGVGKKKKGTKVKKGKGKQKQKPKVRPYSLQATPANELISKKKNELEEVIAKVKQLCERWQCSVADGSDFCYWTHDEPKHFPLCHEHFRA
jgi:hypothetical protein